MFFKKKKRSMGLGKIVVGDGSFRHQRGYERLRDNVLYLNADGTKKVIQVESSIISEGKTTIVSNLAVSLGLTEKKVIVIDLDFRRPKTHIVFNQSIDNGIAEYILGNIDKDTLIKHTEYKNVDLITRGAEIYNSSLVFLSDKFKELIKELKNEYDYILLDCAPVLQVSDYIHICKVSDGVLFVVAYGYTTKSQVVEAIKELKNNETNILGTVFTMYDGKKEKRLGEYWLKEYK